MQGSSGYTLYHRLISEGIICMWTRAAEQQVRDDGKRRAPSSINVAAARFDHPCNFQITSPLKYTAESICLKPMGCVMFT